MLTWAEFRAERPEQANLGPALLDQHGVGLGYLATERADGRPPVLTTRTTGHGDWNPRHEVWKA